MLTTRSAETMGHANAAAIQPMPTYTNDQIAAYLEYYFAGGAAFDTGATNTVTIDITGLTTEGATMAALAMEAWTSVTGINFSLVAGSAQITVDDTMAGASGGPTAIGVFITASSVNLGTDIIATYGTGVDSYAFQVYMREIGHGLGLGSAGLYPAMPVYHSDYSQPGNNFYVNDSWQASVMSAFDQATVGTGSYRTLLTPMIADILAMQNLYGVDGGLRTGNTTYGINSNIVGYYNGNLDAADAFTIIDDGGNDTINFSTTVADMRVDLTPESISDVGGLIGNMTIMRGTIIENFIAGAGNDKITGNTVSNNLMGLAGNDQIWGGAGADFIFGGAGYDKIWGGTGNDQITGNGGIDQIWGEGGSDLISGDGGNDIIWGGGSADSILGGTGDDTLHGGDGNDRILGENGNDSVFGDAGHDQIAGGTGDDQIWGGSGKDFILGQQGADTIYGGAGGDTLSGNIGNDILHGGKGNDVIKGGVGDDFLYGERGRDTLIGGDGADIFVFQNGWSVDRVNDFQDNMDTLSLNADLWGGGTLSVADILSTYASVVADASAAGAHVELNFGAGDNLKVFGVTAVAALLDDIALV